MPSSDRPELKTGTRLTWLRSLLVGYNKSRTLMEQAGKPQIEVWGRHKEGQESRLS
jgi:hypothetical protein